MGLKGKNFKFMSDILKNGPYYKLYTQAKSTSACGLPKGFFYFKVSKLFEIPTVFWGLPEYYKELFPRRETKKVLYKYAIIAVR